MIFPQLLAKAGKRTNRSTIRCGCLAISTMCIAPPNACLIPLKTINFAPSACQWSNTATDSGVWSCLRQELSMTLAKRMITFRG